MRVAVKKLDGVDSVAVSLNEGLAVVRLRPENRLTLEQVRTAIRANGFTPKGAEIRVRGRVIEENGSLALELPGQGLRYLLVDHPERAGLSAALKSAGLGKLVLIEGTVPEQVKRGEAVETLQIRTFSVSPGS